MDVFELTIEGSKADYKESESLPVSLSIKTDKFFSVIGVEGTRVDNAAKQLILPPTLANQRIVEALGDEEGEAVLTIGGAPVFRGSVRKKLVSRKANMLKGFSLSLFGGASQLFASLRGRTLRGLDLGTFLFNGPNAEGTWQNGGFDAGDKCVFAPVFYGYTGHADNNIETAYLRPHIYFAAILEKVWEVLRVDINSTFFGTSYFKQFVHLFGVGDRWDIGGTTGSSLRASMIYDQTVTSTTGQNVDFPDEVSANNEDTGNIWGLSSGTVTPGIWTFSGYMDAFSGCTVEFSIDGVLTQTLQPFQNWQVGPIQITSTTSFRVLARKPSTTAPNGQIFTAPNHLVHIAAKRSGVPGLGDTISLASCLPGEAIVNFLAGISHLFNLAWYFDPIRRQLYCEPRFDYTLPDGVTYEGFYKRSGSSAVDWTKRFDTENYTEAEGSRPFNDWLILNNKAEEGVYYEDATKVGTTEGVPFMGSRYDFGGTGKNGQTVDNPYFENLLICDGSIGAGGPLNCLWMPGIVPEFEDGATQYPDPTYESTGPKYAYFVNDEQLSWKYNGANTNLRPTLYFKPKPSTTTSAVNVSFSDYYSSTTPNYLPGLMRTFYPQWLAILHRGLVLEGKAWLRYSDFLPSPSVFRERKLLELVQDRKGFIFVGVDKFQPLKDEASRATFVQVVPVDEGDLARLRSNLQGHYSAFKFD